MASDPDLLEYLRENPCEMSRSNESFIIPIDAIIHLRRISEPFITLIHEMINESEEEKYDE